MLQVLLLKDLRRARRNPLPWLINLIVPLVMTALIGLVFGGNSEGGALGRIRFALVDEDQSRLSDFLRRAANQQAGNQYFDPVLLERDAAMREINAGHLSAVLIIPTNFVSHYLTATEPVSLELIKNPAESIHPAVLEELLGVAVTGLNGVSRNFNSEFPAWQATLKQDPDYHQISALVDRTGEKLKHAREYLHPPLVTYETGTNSTAGGTGNPAASSTSGLFAFLLLGLSAMFLLFIAGNAMADLQREVSWRTFARYQTLRNSAWLFLAAKIVYVIVMLLLCAGIMLGGGALIFRIHWEHPFALAALTAGYAGFMAAWFAVLAAILPDERRAAVLTSLTGMALGLVGGCAFPPAQLPGFLRDHVTPWMPSFWFADTARNLQSGGAAVAWVGVALQLAAVSLGLAALATFLFRRRFNAGWRP